MKSDIDSPSGMSSVTVTNLQQDVQSVQSINVVFGGALIILSMVVTGIVCVLGNLPIPYISSYYSPVSFAGYPTGTVHTVSKGEAAAPAVAASSTVTSVPATPIVATSSLGTP